ncbi:MAG: hypothetical protein UV05_C0034G0003 [candidate division CPR1 bacterium GW2011_GWA2_42_17]|uniref:N-acetyl sugar amidotransferase n=1 Tax=candidate division CPR1 bacterium GW2011_GWA2_42_17 TaxID=1618341 RepID=A0A0G0Z2I2_9BACT|nr:MAG: hypothetical protein UV05_C0034G0003 [candidate division CPR1 bacterium GW2011_GWA2_42_17]
MKYCTRCLYPANHPLNITFDNEGVCSGCRIHEEKDRLDWADRKNKLAKILNSYRSNTGRNYDCIVPVSGARDSYFIVHTVKNVFKMNPLLVTYNKHYNTKIGIRNLAYLRTIFGCDILTLTVSPAKVKKITKATIKLLGSIYLHCLAGQTVFPVQTAVRFKIPLIIWGTHQGLDQVGMFSHTDEVEMTRKYRKDHDLMDQEAEDLVGQFNLTESDLTPYFYPHDKEIEKVGVRGIYLGNYIRWDSKAQHEQMIARYRYETAKQKKTFDTYNDVDCFNYSDLHDWIRFLKWGYGKVTDHASREIRLKRLTREQGIVLVNKYQNIPPDQSRLKLFLDWLGISEKELLASIDQKRHPGIWRQINNSWQLLDSITNHANDAGVNQVRLTPSPSPSLKFALTSSKNPGETENNYILIGKGYPQ